MQQLFSTYRLSDKQLGAVSEMAQIVVDRSVERAKQKSDETIENLRGRIEKLELSDARKNGAFVGADKIIAYIIGCIGAIAAIYSTMKH